MKKVYNKRIFENWLFLMVGLLYKMTKERSKVGFENNEKTYSVFAELIVFNDKHE